MAAHACNFVLNAFKNGKPVQRLLEMCGVVMTRCHKDESCSKVLNFLEKLDDKIGCAREETVTVFGIHSHKTSGTAKLFHFLKQN